MPASVGAADVTLGNCLSNIFIQPIHAAVTTLHLETWHQKFGAASDAQWVDRVGDFYRNCQRGLVVGNPPRLLSNDGGADEDDSTWHLEAFYRYRVNQNISLIPGFFVLLNPENNSANDTIWVGSFRTVFEF